MKKIILIITVMSLTITASAQFKDTVGMNLQFSQGQLIYEGIVDAPGKSKDELYKNAKQWFVDHFVDSKEVIQNEDKDAGRITGKGIGSVYFKLLTTVELKCKMSIQIDCRDGKYRYRIYDMILKTEDSQYAKGRDYIAEGFVNNLIEQKPDNSFSKGQSKKILTGLNESMAIRIASIKLAMNKKSDDF